MHVPLDATDLAYPFPPLPRPSPDRVWHPYSLILYGETMGSGVVGGRGGVTMLRQRERKQNESWRRK